MEEQEATIQDYSDNIGKLYQDAKSRGVKASEEEFRAYIEGGEENRHKLFNDLSSRGMKADENQFLDYIGYGTTQASQPTAAQPQSTPPQPTPQVAQQPNEYAQKMAYNPYGNTNIPPLIAPQQAMATEDVPEQYRDAYSRMSPAEQRVFSKSLARQQQMSTPEGRSKAAQDMRDVAGNMKRRDPERKKLMEQADALDHSEDALRTPEEMRALAKTEEDNEKKEKTVTPKDGMLVQDNPEYYHTKKEAQRIKDEQYRAIEGRAIAMGKHTDNYAKGSDIYRDATDIFDQTDEGKVYNAKLENSIQLDRDDFAMSMLNSDNEEMKEVAQMYSQFGDIEREGQQLAALNESLKERAKTLDTTNEDAVNAYNNDVKEAQKRYDAYLKQIEEYDKLRKSGAFDKYNEAFQEYITENDESATKAVLQEKNDAMTAMFGDWIDRKSIPLQKKIGKDFTDELMNRINDRRSDVEVPNYLLNNPMHSPLGISGKKTESGALTTASQYAKKAYDLISNEDGSFYSKNLSLVKGFVDDAASMDFLTFGLTEAARGFIDIGIMKKVEAGKEQLNEDEHRAYDSAVEKGYKNLTPEEEAATEKAAQLGRENLNEDEKLAYDAMQNYWQVQQLFKPSGWYTAGQVTAEAFPFIVAMWGSGGIVNAIKGGAKSAEKVALRQAARQAEKMTFKQAAKNVGKAAGNMALEGAVYASTTGLPHTVAGTLEYLMPQSNATYDLEEGGIKVNRLEESEDSVLSAAAKSWGTQMIEGMSEAFSTYALEPLEAAAYARLFGKTAEELAKGGNRAYKDIVRAAFKKGSMGDGIFRNVSSFPNEYIEELFGGFARCVVGLSEWDDEFSGETLAQTAYGLLPMQVVFSAMGGGNLRKHRQRMRQAETFLDEFSPDSKALYDKLSGMSTYEGQDLLDREILSVQQEVDALKQADKFTPEMQQKMAARMNMALVMKEQLYMDEAAATIKDERQRNAYEAATSNLNEQNGNLVYAEYKDKEGNTKQGYVISQDGENTVISDGKKRFKVKSSDVTITDEYTMEDIEDTIIGGEVEIEDSAIANDIANPVAGQDYYDHRDDTPLVFEGGGMLHVDEVDDDGNVTFTLNGRKATVSRRQFRELVQQSRNNMEYAEADTKAFNEIGKGMQSVAVRSEDPMLNAQLGRRGRDARAYLAEAVGEERVRQMEQMNGNELARAYAEADATTKTLMQNWMELGGYDMNRTYEEAINERVNEAANQQYKRFEEFALRQDEQTATTFSERGTVTTATLDGGERVIVGTNDGNEAVVMDMAGNMQFVSPTRLTDMGTSTAMSLARQTTQGVAKQMQALQTAYNGTAFQADTEHTIAISDEGKEDKAVIVGFGNNGSVAYATEYSPNKEGGYNIANRSVKEVSADEFRDMVEGAQRKAAMQQARKAEESKSIADQGVVKDGQDVTVMVGNKPAVGKYVLNAGHHFVVDAEGKVIGDFKSMDELKASMQEAQAAAKAGEQMAREAELVEQSEMEKEYQRRLDEARTPEEKAAVIQEFIDQIKTDETLVLTAANQADVLRKNGVSEETIAKHLQYYQSVKASGDRMGGFFVGGIRYLLAEEISSIEHARSTYVHERQHGITENNVSLLNEIANAASKDELLAYVQSLSGSNAYDNASQSRLANEFISMAMEVAYRTADVEAALRGMGISNDKLIQTIKQLDDEQRKSDSLAKARRGEGRGVYVGDNAESGGRPDGTNQGREPGDVGESGLRPVRGSQQQTEDNEVRPSVTGFPTAFEGYTPEEVRQLEDNIDIASDGMTEDGDSIRYSVSSLFDGLGLTSFRTDKKGNKTPLTDEDGNVIANVGNKVFDGYHLMTVKDLTSIKDSTWNTITKMALDAGYVKKKDVDMLNQKYVDIINTFLTTGLNENGGAENLISRWMWLGETVFRTIAKNGDKQYSFSADITRLCKKNEQIIKAISAMQSKVGYGITPSQIMDIYLETFEQGWQVPCPVCYVFSRYIRNGKYATAAVKGMETYGKHLQGGSEPWTEARWEQELERLTEKMKRNKRNAALISKAQKALDEIPDKVDEIGKTLMNAKSGLITLTDEQVADYMRQIDQLNEQYQAAMDLYANAALTNWIKSFAIQKKKGQWVLRKDSKLPTDMEDFKQCALDLRKTAVTIGKYPGIQRLRRSGGAAAGKEITFASNNAIGEFLAGIGSGNPETAANVFEEAAKASPAKKKEAMAKALKRLQAAYVYAQRQSLRGGQRMWSWSDNLENLMPDVAMNLMQLQLLGGALQSYSKQLEGINMVARMGGYVNGSLMAKDNGYAVLTDEDIEWVDGKPTLKEDITETIEENTPKGKVQRTRVLAEKGAPVYQVGNLYYTAMFDDIIGVDFYGRDGKKGLKDLNNELDKAGNIIVGMNDIHIRVCLADDRIFFCIPWHSSGASNHILQQMLNILGTDISKFVSTDYTAMQEEKNFAKGGVVPQKVVEIWESHKNEKDWKSGIGVIESGDGKGGLSEQQKRYRALRKAIFDGSIWNNEEMLKQAQKDEFLKQVIRKMKQRGLTEMTNSDNDFIYPYEYWDEQSTYENADINGLRYAEYCRRLGVKPKFTGRLDGEKWTDVGNFIDDKGYWKLLIDRRMYDTKGKFQDLTSIDASGFSTDLVDPEKNAEQFHVTQVAEDAGIENIVEAVDETERQRLGQEHKVDYSMPLEQGLKNFNDKFGFSQEELDEEAANLPAEEEEDEEEEGGDTLQYSITAEQDKAYMDAVNRGDMETAQRMVMDAAKAAMPNTKVVDENGNPLVVYRASSLGGNGDYTVFDESKGGNYRGFYFTNRESAERNYSGRNLRAFFLNVTNPDTSNNFNVLQGDKSELPNNDGMIYAPNGIDADTFEVKVFNPNQIKSAEPFTFDDNGELIPLSERFNPNNNDIRYSVVSAAKDVLDKWENQDGSSDYPYLTNDDLVNMVDENEYLNADERIALAVYRYRKLKQEDYEEGMRDYSGGEADDLVENELIPRIEQLANNDINYSFIGKQGAARMDVKERAMTRMNSLYDARRLEEMLGKSDDAARKIKLATGWERGKDGKWRYEISDNNYKYYPNADRRFFEEHPFSKEYEELYLKGARRTDDEDDRFVKMVQERINAHKEFIAQHSDITLDDVIEHEELFMAYPRLRGIKVVYEDMKEGYWGNYDEAKNEISINKNASQPMQKSTLIHEIQHIIQRIEGFARGGNPETAAQIVKEMGEKEKIWGYKLSLDEAAEQHPEHADDADALLNDILDGMTEEEAIKQGWIPEEKLRKVGFKVYQGKYKGDSYENAYNQWNKKLREVGRTNYFEGNPFKLYKRLAGEVEARNTQARMDMTYAERLEQLAKETEDVAREDQLIMMAGDPILYSVTANEDADMGRPTMKEITTEYLWKLAEQNQNDWLARADAVTAFNQLLADTMLEMRNMGKADKLSKKTQGQISRATEGAARAQERFDKTAAEKVMRMAQMMMRYGNMDSLTRGEVNRLMSAMKNAIEPQGMFEQAQKVIDIMVQNQLRDAAKVFGKQLRTKTSKLNASGVEVQAGLDLQGQHIIKVLRDAIKIKDVAEFNEKLRDAMDGMGSDSKTKSENASLDYAGLLLAKQYIESIRDNAEQEKAIKKDLKDKRAEIYDEDGKLKPEFKGKLDEEHARIKKEVQQYEQAATERLRDLRMERIDAYARLSKDLADVISGSRDRAKEWAEREMERAKEIQHNANSDLQGIPAREQPRTRKELSFGERLEGSGLTQLLTASTRNFNEYLRFFGDKSPDGRGYLWNRFMPQVTEARDSEWANLQYELSRINTKIAELTKGKAQDVADLMAMERKMDTITVSYRDGDEITPHEMTQGEALYIYMVDKMPDGAMKLRSMGITEEDVRDIESQLDETLVEFADWVQEDYLPSIRERYNEVHQRMFGAPMANITDYFPLKINSDSRQKEEQLGVEFDKDMPSTVTGAIIARKHNNTALNLKSDAMSVLVQHIMEMEHWAAYAELSRDLGTLLSYKRFRNRAKSMSSARLGGVAKVNANGKEDKSNIYENFKKTCNIVCGTFSPTSKTDEIDKQVRNIVKGVTAAKINFRLYTAAKQITSAPAFWTKAAPQDIAKNLFPILTKDTDTGELMTTWKWAIENLPGFAKRWQSRQAGNEMLDTTDTDWGIWKNKFVAAASRIGMTPNAFIDAVTVIAGSKAVFDTSFRRYKNAGYNEEEAKKKALLDASVAYNESQQSQDPAYLSIMQANRTFLNSAFSLFRNSSFGYWRNYTRAIHNIKKMSKKGYKEETLEFLTKQAMRDGLTEEQAKKLASKTYNRQWYRSIADVALFGFIIEFAWNIAPYAVYLLGGDDKKKRREMLTDAARHSVFGSIEGMPGGNLASTFINDLWAGRDVSSFSYHLLPILSDIEKIKSEYATDKVAMANDIIGLLLSSFSGVDPRGVSDIVVAIMDACNGDPELSIGAALCIMRIAEVPQSQLDELMIDEIGMTAGEARRLPADQVAKRYANYKLHRNAPLTSWAYDDEAKQKKLTKYENVLLKKADDRLANMSEEDKEQLFDETDDITVKGKMAKGIYSEYGLDQDYEGAKPTKNDSETTTRKKITYQKMRTLEDVKEDAALRSYMSGLDKESKEYKAVSKDKKELDKVKEFLGDKKDENDKKAMERYRSIRKKIIDKYNIEIK